MQVTPLSMSHVSRKGKEKVAMSPHICLICSQDILMLMQIQMDLSRALMMSLGFQLSKHQVFKKHMRVLMHQVVIQVRAGLKWSKMCIDIDI